MVFLRFGRFSGTGSSIDMRNLTILGYHRIFPSGKRNCSLFVTPEMFEKQFDYYLKNKYQNITLGDYYDFWQSGKLDDRKKYFAITFDDGYQDNYYYAWPLLKKYKLKATIFVTTGYINKKEPFWFDLKNFTEFQKEDYCLTETQIKELASAGIEFGSHTVDHYELTSLGLVQLKHQLRDSKKTLERIIDTSISAICYPRGKTDQSVIDAAAEAGYKVGVVTRNRETTKLPESLLALDRISLYEHNSYKDFLLKNNPVIRKLKYLL
jgi:peptidoglycan/xylan/chitin deacetylase (PgdA/CDA1 family)